MTDNFNKIAIDCDRLLKAIKYLITWKKSIS